MYVGRKFHHNLKTLDLNKVLWYCKALYIITRNFSITFSQKKKKKAEPLDLEDNCIIK